MKYNLENIYKQLDEKEKIITCFKVGKYSSFWTRVYGDFLIFFFILPILSPIYFFGPELRRLIVITETNIHFFKFKNNGYLYSYSIAHNRIKSTVFNDNLFSKKQYYLHINTGEEKKVFDGIYNLESNEDYFSEGFLLNKKTKELILTKFNSK